MPQAGQSAQHPTAAAATMSPDVQGGTNASQGLNPAPQASETPTVKKPSLAQRMSADPSTCAHTPAVSAFRPAPLPKMRAAAAKSRSVGLMSRIKKAVSGSSKGTLDARQKKAAILVGVLSLVLTGVLVISLGGLGRSDAKAAAKTTSSSGSAAQTQQPKPLQWEKPQPLPAELRNPMSPLAVSRTGQSSGAPADGAMIVKGIVFSKDNPSAIIDSQVVRQGEVINGVTVVQINKDSVEFQMGDKRWTQQVQR